MISYIDIALAPGHFFLDAGAIGDNISMVTGMVVRYGNANTPEIAGTYLRQVPFRTNRSGANFKYVVHSGFTPSKAYKVALGLSEITATACTGGKRKFSIVINGKTVPTCMNGKRVMSISVNGNLYVNNLDVFKEAGCGTALLKSYVLGADAQGKIAVEIGATVENAMLSSIEITAP
jgi:hypothetical protein